MEGGVHPVETSAFRDLFALTKKNPFILRLAFSAGIGGLLFGYDTGVISGALLYIRDDFESVGKSTFWQETIVSMAIAGAIMGAAIGGWVNDKFGRRIALLWADALFFLGAIVMAFAPNPYVLVIGRVFVGFGVGIASMSSPLYISEASPAKIRGALVSTNNFLITGGQFLSYLINLAFTRVPYTWRWMLGVAAVPAAVQFVLMFFLPESPRWLYRQGRTVEAEATLRKIYLGVGEADSEIADLKESVRAEKEEAESKEEFSMFHMLKTKSVRRGLIAGVGLQVFQQFVGINTVMYYSPTIVQLAGYASNQTALLLSLITSGLNAVGSVVSIFFIDKTGRKNLLIISLSGLIISLGLLAGVFHETATHSPPVSPSETSLFGNLTCPAYFSAIITDDRPTWDCMACLKAQDCGFCASPTDKLFPGACMISNPTAKGQCHGDGRWYTRGCPSKFGWVSLVGLGLYIISFSPGMGTAPWIVNSEIYPLRYRGVCGGIAATANWISNLIVAYSFLTLTEAIGTSWTFFMFGIVSVLALLFVLVCVPETKGLPIEEIEKVLENRSFCFWERNKKTTHTQDDTKLEE